MSGHSLNAGRKTANRGRPRFNPCSGLCWMMLSLIGFGVILYANAGKNGKSNEMPDLSKFNMEDEEAEALQRLLATRLQELRAQQGGWLLLTGVDNSPMGRGVLRYQDLDLEQAHALTSFWGELRLSRVKNTVRHVTQFHWLLEKMGINPEWTALESSVFRSSCL